MPSRQRRLWEVIAVMGRHALVAGGEAITGRLRGGPHPQAGPAHLRAALEELGPTFIKLGQLLSGRSDLLPAGYQEALSQLRDHVQQVPAGAVREQIEGSLGRPVSEAFADFDWEPIASASVGQVHAAVLPDGRAAVVKVRRPGIGPQIEADLDLLDGFARAIVRVGILRRYDPVGLVHNFGSMLRCEIDYTVEAANARHIGRALAGQPNIVTPVVFEPLSDDAVLTMDRLDGVALNDRDGLDAAGVDRGKLATAVVRTYMSMVLLQDRFHADPHPGNLFAMSADRLGIVDFGETGTVSPGTRAAMSAMIVAIGSDNAHLLAETVLQVCTATRALDKAALASDLQGLLATASGMLGSIRLAQLLGGLMGTLRRHGLWLPSDLALLLKTIIECESTAAEVDPHFDPASMLTEFGGGLPRLLD